MQANDTSRPVSYNGVKNFPKRVAQHGGHPGPPVRSDIRLPRARLRSHRISSGESVAHMISLPLLDYRRDGGNLKSPASRRGPIGASGAHLGAFESE